MQHGRASTHKWKRLTRISCLGFGLQVTSVFGCNDSMIWLVQDQDGYELAFFQRLHRICSWDIGVQSVCCFEFSVKAQCIVQHFPQSEEGQLLRDGYHFLLGGGLCKYLIPRIWEFPCEHLVYM